MMTTIHAYTNDQRILDLVHKDLRRARAAGQNLIITTTGAAKSIGKVIPVLDGKLDGISVRAPVSCCSLVDLVVDFSREVTVDDINNAVKAAAEGPMKGILEYCVDPIVSSDIKNNPASCVFDSLATMVLGKKGKEAKVLAWYDNEWAYSCRTVELMKKMADMLGKA
jgi:glyceraldehyde 3-phosphate dehydrogenase